MTANGSEVFANGSEVAANGSEAEADGVEVVTGGVEWDGVEVVRRNGVEKTMAHSDGMEAVASRVGGAEIAAGESDASGALQSEFDQWTGELPVRWVTFRSAELGQLTFDPEGVDLERVDLDNLNPERLDPDRLDPERLDQDSAGGKGHTGEADAGTMGAEEGQVAALRVLAAALSSIPAELRTVEQAMHAGGYGRTPLPRMPADGGSEADVRRLLRAAWRRVLNLEEVQRRRGQRCSGAEGRGAEEQRDRGAEE